MSTEITIQEPRFQCRHVFTDGRRCGSPALRAQNFCYYHHTSRLPIQDAPTRKRRQSTFHIPNPADLSERSGIQHTIGLILRRIASNEVDPRRAGLLLYGLQIASLNLGKAKTSTPARDIVDDITIDPTGATLAPEAPFVEPARFVLPSVEEFLQELADDQDGEDHDDDIDDDIDDEDARI